MLRDSKRKPHGYELFTDERELGINWDDGSKSRYELEALRRSCPCAQCKEIRLNRSEEGGLNEDVKKGVLTALLVAAGIEIVAGG